MSADSLEFSTYFLKFDFEEIENGLETLEIGEEDKKAIRKYMRKMGKDKYFADLVSEIRLENDEDLSYEFGCPDSTKGYSLQWWKDKAADYFLDFGISRLGTIQEYFMALAQTDKSCWCEFEGVERIVSNGEKGYLIVGGKSPYEIKPATEDNVKKAVGWIVIEIEDFIA